MFDFAQWSKAESFHWVDYSFPSVLQLNDLIEQLLEPVECPSISRRLRLGLQEALVNSVRHGNANDPTKALRVRRIVTPHWLVWQIQDEGPGVPLEARVGLLPEKLDANSGRGLFLIYQCFEDVRWSRRGNRLQLACRREASINGGGTQDPLFPD